MQFLLIKKRFYCPITLSKEIKKTMSVEYNNDDGDGESSVANNSQGSEEETSLQKGSQRGRAITHKRIRGDSSQTQKRHCFRACDRSHTSITLCGHSTPIDLIFSVLANYLSIFELARFACMNKEIFLSMAKDGDFFFVTDHIVRNLNRVSIPVSLSFKKPKKVRINQLISRCGRNQNLKHFSLITEHSKHYFCTLHDLFKVRSLETLDFGLIGHADFKLDGLSNLNLRELTIPWSQRHTNLSLLKNMTRLEKLVLGAHSHCIEDIRDLPTSVCHLELRCTLQQQQPEGVSIRDWSRMALLKNLAHITLHVEKVEHVQSLVGTSFCALQSLEIVYVAPQNPIHNQIQVLSVDQVSFGDMPRLRRFSFDAVYHTQFSLKMFFLKWPVSIEHIELKGHYIPAECACRYKLPFLKSAKLDSIAAYKYLPLEQLQDLVLTARLLTEQDESIIKSRIMCKVKMF